MKVTSVRTPSRRITDADLQFITDNWQELSDAEMGDVLGRTANAIQNIRQTLGVKRDSRGNPMSTSAHAPEPPSKPRGMNDEQREFVRMYPDHKEAKMLRAMQGEDMRA